MRHLLWAGFLATLTVYCSSRAFTPKDVKATKLTELGTLPAAFRAAAEAAANYLKGKGEQPSEFFVSDISRTAKTIILPLWHISAFRLKQRAVGNPGGKCRNLEYDTVTGRITGEYFWQ
jgi:hypothetical protein